MTAISPQLSGAYEFHPPGLGWKPVAWSGQNQPSGIKIWMGDVVCCSSVLLFIVIFLKKYTLHGGSVVCSGNSRRPTMSFVMFQQVVDTAQVGWGDTGK